MRIIPRDRVSQAKYSASHFKRPARDPFCFDRTCLQFARPGCPDGIEALFVVHHAQIEESHPTKEGNEDQTA
jgi:hypothetical protein